MTTSPISCARALFPIPGVSLPNTSSSNSEIPSSPCDSDSCLSSYASSRESTPEIPEGSHPSVVLKLYRQWQQYGPGWEPRVNLGNHEYTVSPQDIGSGSFKRVRSAISDVGETIAVIYANKTKEESSLFIDNEIKALILCDIKKISGTLRLLDKPCPIGKNWERYMTSFCEGGTINSWAKGKPLSEKLKVLLGVAVTLEELHAQNFAHCDVKSENIGINRGKSVLLDYGLFTESGHERGKGMTLAYLPPKNHPSSAIESDVFSFGATLYEIVKDEISCGSLCNAVMHSRGWDSPIAYLYNATQADIDAAVDLLNTPEELKNLLRFLLKVNPKERISSGQARQELERLIQ